MKRRTNTYRLIVLLLFGSLGYYYFYLRPEAKIKHALQAAIHAVEQEDLDGVLAFLHPQYTDSLGMNREAWRLIAQTTWRRWKDINIRLLQPEIHLNGDEARVKFHVLVDATWADSMKPGTIPDRQTAGRQNLEWLLVNDHGRWRLRDSGSLTPAEWKINVEEALPPE